MDEAAGMQGETLAHYKVGRLLGKGGMGEVYEADDLKLGRKVALKVLREDVTSDTERRTRFEREARIVASLRHPHIVTIHAIEEAAGRFFLVMELIDGEPLDRVIPRGGLTLERFFEIALPLADALATAHGHGITHRDLKPGNLLIDREGAVWVLDFGLAKLVEPPAGGDGLETLEATEALTSEGKILGTVNYMSPEQLQGEPVDRRSDIFSLGIVLYEMAAGVRPFAGKSSAAVMSAILRDEPPPLCGRTADAPRHLERIIRRCLQKKPADRFQSARDVYLELKSLRPELTGTDDWTSTIGPHSPQAARRRWSAAVAVAIGVTLAIGAAWWAFREGTPAVGRPAAGSTRLAVLPLKNIGPSDDDAFAEGVTEEITSRLASVGGLAVISGNSAFQYADTDKSNAQIGSELNAQYLVTGSVRWASGATGERKVRIISNLVRVADDTNVWSQVYDRRLEDIFEIQSEIALAVARQTGAALLPAEQAALEEPPTENLAAYQAYLRGRQIPQNCDGRLSKVQSLEKAVEIDPGFTEAWATLAFQHTHHRTHCLDRSPERRAAAQRALKRAVELDPQGRATLMARTMYVMQVETDFQKALRILGEAGEAVEREAGLLTSRATILRRMGRWQETLDDFNAAFALDPKNTFLAVKIASAHMYMRSYHQAIEWFDKTLLLGSPWPGVAHRKAWSYWLWRGDTAAAGAVLELVPASATDGYTLWTRLWQKIYEGRAQDAIDLLAATDRDWLVLDLFHWPKALGLAFAYEAVGDMVAAAATYDEARRALETKIAEATDPDPRLLRAVALAYAGMGEKEKAIAAARQATEIFPVEEHPYFGTTQLENLARVYARVDEPELAIDILETLLSMPALVSLPMLRLDPAWAPLRGHPRFAELEEEYGSRHPAR